MINTFIGNLGHLLVIITLVTSFVAAFCYYKASVAQSIQRKQSWSINGRTAFIIHTLAIFGIVYCLFHIIYHHYFEYHYAWSHSSIHLPGHYMISCFWEGQEGSFLLWMFWNALLGLVLIKTNKFWEAPVMTVFAAVQAFLSSMILGVVFPEISFTKGDSSLFVISEALKVGSSPFILLRDAIEAPIFQSQPNFVPEDGNGLNPLLQNYWMVIHPPTLFLGFATTLVPFAYCIAGLWQKRYKEWVRPALPWALFSGAVLGLGILMGGYWAYETLNFGGYWNWDPVENAVYVPWLFLVASIHTMITARKSEQALQISIILVITTFILILYSTFLTRSGVLGETSVHSFTDLGLSGQLLLYLIFFTILSIILCVWRWKSIPKAKEEVNTYSREFWIFVGATTLCLMGFQVLVPTSIPVFNKIVELFGGESNMAPPADQVLYYSKFQLWFAVGVALLSGTGQFFWWNKIDAEKLKKALSLPLIISALVATAVMVIGKVDYLPYIILLVAGIYSVVANFTILSKVLKTSPRLSGGAIAHIGIAMMLIGIMFSSGYSTVVSLNNTGMLISRDATDEFNKENLLLFINEPRRMAGYELLYKGDFVEPRKEWGYINKNDIRRTSDEHNVIAKRNIAYEGKPMFDKGDTIEIYPENTYYQIEYTAPSGKKFNLYPRAQVNEDMGGLLASPDIKRSLGKDLYTHVASIPNPSEEIEWSEPEEFEVKKGQQFFINDYVAVFEEVKRVEADEVDGATLSEDDIAVKAIITVEGKARKYTLEPVYMIRENSYVARIPYILMELGLKVSLLHIHPETETFTVSVNTTQKPWLVLKAMEKPMINVLWAGTILLMIGFSIAINRRYVEFMKMRDKNQE